MADREDALEPRHCWMCGKEVAIMRPVWDPGAMYGPDRPVFCSREHLEPWVSTSEAAWMRLGEAFRQVGRALLGMVRR
jgi:hypothetical protein